MSCQRFVPLLLSALACSISFGQNPDLPTFDQRHVLADSGANTGVIPLDLQFAPDGKNIYCRYFSGQQSNKLTRLRLEDGKSHTVQIDVHAFTDTRYPSMIFTESDALVVSCQNMYWIKSEKDSLSATKHKLPWKEVSSAQMAIVQLTGRDIRISRIRNDNDTIESVQFQTKNKSFNRVLGYPAAVERRSAVSLVDTGTELICGYYPLKPPLTQEYALQVTDDRPAWQPLLTVKDGCISFQKVDDYYVIGSNAGRLCFLSSDKKTEPLEANVLKMCIQQVVVRKGADGV